MSGVGVKHLPNGIVVLWSANDTTPEFVSALSGECAKADIAHAFIWFSSLRHDAFLLQNQIVHQLPELSFCGCSTSGEITPDGLQDGGIVALLLPASGFDVTVGVMGYVDQMGMDAIAAEVAEHREGFIRRHGHSDANFVICLNDGLGDSEERATLAVARGLGGIAMIGGSAGDDLRFQATWQICREGVYRHATLLAFIHSRLPFELFTDNNFIPTDQKLVVTEADVDSRRVIEFNAEPAALAYAQALGIQTDELDAQTFASNPLVVRVGGAYHCRSIRQFNDDLSLSFFCAIDNGLVLTVAGSVGMVDVSRGTVDNLRARLGTIDAIFGFDCVYRKLDAQHRQTTHRIAAFYQDIGFVGFNTYGEQFLSMHINQTFTGVAFGRAHANTEFSQA